MRTPPLPRDPVGYSSCQCDHGMGSTEATGVEDISDSDELWKTVELCWLGGRNACLRVEDTLFCLEDAATFWYDRAPVPTYNEGTERCALTIPFHSL